MNTPEPARGLPEFPVDSTDGDLTPQIQALVSGRALTLLEAKGAFTQLMSGRSHPAQMGALLALMSTRILAVDEIVAAVTVMREHVDRVDTGVPPDLLLDTAGTGGTAKLFNISTAAALVAAAAGARVAKHGNRSRTGRGSAEVLQGLGVNIDAGQAAQRRSMDVARICFCFAVHHHPATKSVMPVRKSLGIFTIFNLLGPLTNPAGARRQIMGLHAPHYVRPVADALMELGVVRALVLHGTDGLDECSITAPTHLAHVEGAVVTEHLIQPEQYGISPSPHRALVAQDLPDAVRVIRDLFSGVEQGPRKDILLINAGLAIWAAGLADDLTGGMKSARLALESGGAEQTLRLLCEASQE